MKTTTHRSTFGVPKIDLTGKTFGRLFVRFQDDPRKSRRGKRERWELFWNCVCSCGTNNVLVSGDHLRLGRVKSCGCLQKETRVIFNTRHGMSRSTEYNSYIGAMRRCNSPKNPKYKIYGGRGIKFLFTSFEQFYSEIGPKPKGKTLDRIKNNGNYEPGNVRWATPKQQANNRRNSTTINP